MILHYLNSGVLRNSTVYIEKEIVGILSYDFNVEDSSVNIYNVEYFQTGRMMQSPL